MSSTLYYRPVIHSPNGKSLDQLKFVLKKRYGCSTIHHTMTHLDIPYLEGLRDVGGDNVSHESDELIKAIMKHDEIELHEVF